MSEVTLEMLLSGAKPAPAPTHAAPGAMSVAAAEGASSGDGAPAEEESFSAALSRQTAAHEGEGADAEASDAGEGEVSQAVGEGEGEGLAVEAVDEVEVPIEVDVDPELVVEEVELPPGLEFLDLPVASVTLPLSGNGLPAAAATAESPVATLATTQLVRPAEMALGEAGGDPTAAHRKAVAAAVTAQTVAEKPAEGEGDPRLFAQLLGGRAAAVSTAAPANESAASAAPTLAAVQSAAPAGVAPTQAAAAAEAPVRSAIDTPFRQPGWNDSLGNRVVWMANEKIEKAEIRLNPPSMGPIEVRVTMNGDQASVSFVAQNANVRDALEQAMPRLREMMGENGLNLAEADVSDAHRDQRAQEEGEGNGRGRDQGGDGVEGDDEGLVGGEAVAVGDGMLDLYA